MDWDLKLGPVMEDGGEALHQHQPTPPLPLPLPLGRRRRPSSSSSSSSCSAEQLPSCLVDGCTSDLNACREYHRRHRVCERHSKTPVVRVAGLHQRFCQQCSRFQPLGEFDDAKRSCRRRLEGHNRRRRKTQPETAVSLAAQPMYPPMPGGPSSSFGRDHLDCALSLLSTGAPLHHHHFHADSPASSNDAGTHLYDGFDDTGAPCRIFPSTWDFK